MKVLWVTAIFTHNYSTTFTVAVCELCQWCL